MASRASIIWKLEADSRSSVFGTEKARKVAGAGGRTRTDMSLTSPDFESGAYTNFATPAVRKIIRPLPAWCNGPTSPYALDRKPHSRFSSTFKFGTIGLLL